MKKIRVLILLSLVIVIASCGFSTDGGGFRTSDKEYTRLLYVELNKNNIQYTVSQEGYIMYDETAKKGFLKAQVFVEHYLYDGVNHKMTSTQEQDFFISLLKEKDLEYYVLTKDDGIWVKWFPESEAQDQELTLQVVNYVFDNRQKTSIKN